MQAGVSATVVDARFCKPLDTEMLRSLATEHSVMITVEEGSVGGFAAHVMQVCIVCSGLAYSLGHSTLNAASLRAVPMLGGSHGWQTQVPAHDTTRSLH